MILFFNFILECEILYSYLVNFLLVFHYFYDMDNLRRYSFIIKFKPYFFRKLIKLEAIRYFTISNCFTLLMVFVIIVFNRVGHQLTIEKIKKIAQEISGNDEKHHKNDSHNQQVTHNQGRKLTEIWGWGLRT